MCHKGQKLLLIYCDIIAVNIKEWTMSYWSEEDIGEMTKRNQKMIKHRKIAIGIAIPALLLALSLTVVSVLANEPLWIVVLHFSLLPQFTLLLNKLNF